MTRNKPGKTIRSVLDACADCDTCRFLMDESCPLFPELYRLYDQEKEKNEPADYDALRKLADRCTLCGLCPCPNIRADVIREKTERVREEGMPLGVRLLADVQTFGRWGSLAPKVLNKVLSFAAVRQVAKKIAAIHPKRDIPELAGENFFHWAQKKGLVHAAQQAPKVTYFAGCSAGYLFPDVAKATVRTLHSSGVSICVPPQQCCGMPSLLEGDAPTALKRMGANLKILLQALADGYDLVCSCPTCGFLMKVLLKEGAFYSTDYQQSVSPDDNEMWVPGNETGTSSFMRLKKSVYTKILTDNSYFSDLEPLERINLAANIMDLGQYLERLHGRDRLNTQFAAVPGHMVYYAPCHQREQRMGTPYLDLLSKIPDLKVKRVGNQMDCCGMGGSLGYKQSFHDMAKQLAEPLMREIQAAQPEAIITDCLSCRLQFQHLLPYPVFHPVEIISQGY